MSIKGQRGIVPIGCSLWFAKSTTNTPSLATQGRDEYIEEDGQTIDDVESPINGQTIADVNGTTDATKKFIRGATTSGGVGSSTTHSHCISYNSYLTYG